MGTRPTQARYMTQMSPFEGYNIALYDLAIGAPVAQFANTDLAERVKEMLNKEEQK